MAQDRVAFRRVRGRIIPIRLKKTAEGAAYTAAGAGVATAAGFVAASHVRDATLHKNAGASAFFSMRKLKNVEGPRFRSLGKKYKAAQVANITAMKKAHAIGRIGLIGSTVIASHGLQKLYQGVTGNTDRSLAADAGALGTAVVINSAMHARLSQYNQFHWGKLKTVNWKTVAHAAQESASRYLTRGGKVLRTLGKFTRIM